jgi:hypothetical protein
MVHIESSMRAVCVVILEQTSAAIANCIAEISAEFPAKEAAAREINGGRTVSHQALRQKVL